MDLSFIKPAMRQPELGDTDSIVQIDNTPVMVSEIIGKRPHQEDVFFAIGTPPREKGLLKIFLQRTFAAASVRAHQALMERLENDVKPGIRRRIEDIDLQIKGLETLLSGKESLSDTPERQQEQEILRTTIHSLVTKSFQLEEYLQEPPIGGSTAVVIVASADNKTIATANLGDSPAAIFVLEENGHVTAHKLTRDHTPDDPDEVKRVEAEGGRIGQLHGVTRLLHTDPDVEGGIAMTRAFGDTDHKGISDIPDIKKYDISDFITSPKDRVFLMVSCDGFFGPHTDMAHEDYIPLVKQAICDGREKDIAKLLVDYANYNGSHDNLSVMITELKPGRTQDLVLGVFDGHGTDKGARMAASTIENAFLGKELPPLSAVTSILPRSQINERQ